MTKYWFWLIFGVVATIMCFIQGIKGDKEAWLPLLLCVGLVVWMWSKLRKQPVVKVEDNNINQIPQTIEIENNNINQIPHYDDWGKEYYYMSILYKMKREQRYVEALGLLDFIENNCSNILNKYSLQITTNKHRAIIYRKLKRKDLGTYYDVLCQINVMINAAFRSSDNQMLSDYYFYEQFSYENEKINNAIQAYIEWFKPLSVELIFIIKNIQKKQLDFELTNNCKSSIDAEMYLYEHDKDLNNILKQIDNHPFYAYYSKYNTLEISDYVVKFIDTKPYIKPDITPSTNQSYGIDLRPLAHKALENIAERKIGRQISESERQQIKDKFDSIIKN